MVLADVGLLLADGMSQQLFRSSIQYQLSQMFLAHLGLNHSMALVDVGIVLAMLSIVMNHCKNLLYIDAIA